VFRNGNSEKKESIFSRNPEFLGIATSEPASQKSTLLKIKKQQLIMQISLLDDMADLK
jgi:hypothetical protein